MTAFFIPPHVRGVFYFMRTIVTGKKYLWKFSHSLLLSIHKKPARISFTGVGFYHSVVPASYIWNASGACVLLSNNCYMIDANKILQADALDLIFEGRNKEYGAYELRSNYRKRLTIAVGTMLALCGCVVLLNSFTGTTKKTAQMYIVPDTHMIDLADEKKPDPPQVEPPKPKVQVQTIRSVVPVIAPDKEVDPKDVPPTQDEMQDVKIGTANVEGFKSDVVAPPIDDKNKGVIDLPAKKEEKEPDIYLTVQIESEYPGGMQAWLRYLNKTLPKYYTDDLIEQEMQGRVTVQFVVDTDGNVSDVRGVEGPKGLMEAAEKVIRLSGKWTPAIQNGHKVKSYKRQPIVFQLQQE